MTVTKVMTALNVFLSKYSDSDSNAFQDSVILRMIGLSARASLMNVAAAAAIAEVVFMAPDTMDCAVAVITSGTPV